MPLFDMGEFQELLKEGFDDLINQFGKTCRLVYPHKNVSCINCTTSPIGNKPGYTYRHGGPTWFKHGTPCPICNGEGFKAEVQTEDIKMVCHWGIRDFELGVPIHRPYEIVKTDGFLTDLPKIRNADYCIIQVPFIGYAEQKFNLFRGPHDPHALVQDRYFSAYWKRRS